jgi:hypothetical protein
VLWGSDLKSFEIDFHYYTVEEALRLAEGILNQARLNDEPVYCQFITGRGKIQKELIKVFSEIYELNPVIPYHNKGVVLVEVY